MSKQIRPYQANAIKAVSKGLEKSITKQLLVMCTGSGKTFTAVKAVEQFNFKRTLWLTHQTELLSQSGLAFLSNKISAEFAAKVKEEGFIDWAMRSKGLFRNPDEFSMGVIKADDFNIDADVVMASVQTLHRRLHLIPPDYFECVVVDECHLIASKQYVAPINYFTPKLLLGLTATPLRMDNISLASIYGEIIYDYDIATGIKEGYLCELEGIRVKTDLSLDNVKSSNGDFNISELSAEVDIPERNNLIVDSYIQYTSGRQGMFFCVDINHAIHLAEVFNEKGIKCKAVSSDETRTGDRDKAIQQYESGEITVLTNVDVLSTGVDVPNTGVVGHSAPTKSIAKWLQRTGRLTRLKDQAYVDKYGQKAVILDFCDSTTKHKLVNAWSLDSGIATEDKVFITQEKKDFLISERENRKKILIAKTSKVDVRVNLLELPQIKINDSPKMQEPATEKQLEWIAKEGFDIVNISYTKRQCTEIISNLSATPKQIALLKYKGYDTSNGVTIAEFQAAIKEVEKKEMAKIINAAKSTIPQQDQPYF